jgi:hypothetical protein
LATTYIVNCYFQPTYEYSYGFSISDLFAKLEP